MSVAHAETKCKDHMKEREIGEVNIFIFPYCNPCQKQQARIVELG